MSASGADGMNAFPGVGTTAGVGVRGRADVSASSDRIGVSVGDALAIGTAHGGVSFMEKVRVSGGEVNGSDCCVSGKGSAVGVSYGGFDECGLGDGREFVQLEMNKVTGGQFGVVDGGEGCSVEGSGNGGFNAGKLALEDVVNPVVSGCVGLDLSLQGKVKNHSMVDNLTGDVNAVGDNDALSLEEMKMCDSSMVGNNSDNVKNIAGKVDMQDSMINGLIKIAGPSDGDVVNLVVDLNSCLKSKGESDSEGRTGSSVNGGLDSTSAGRHENAREKRKIGREVHFLAPDLVWGKVRSHPWWPGQIFEPWDASEKAKKHFRPNSYLVAYFGDQTFAWNEELKLKPFWPNFSELAKQSSAEAFVRAIDCSLEEAYRRVEFSLSCRCVDDGAYSKISTQIVENSGIREESRVRERGDRFFTASCVEPVKFVPYIKTLALLPDVELEKLEVVMARALLSAFYRWKGYYNMAEFNVSGQLFENEVDDSSFMGKGETLVAMEDLENKHVGSDSIGRTKRKRRLTDLMVEEGLYLESKKQSKRKVGRPSFSSAAKEQKPVESLNSKRRKGSADLYSKGMERSLKVGEGIRKFASQLSRASKLEHDNALSYEKVSRTNSGTEKSQGKKTISPEGYCSADEMLSQLQLAAKDPLRGYSFLRSIFSFFSDFRNSVANDDQSLGDFAKEISDHETKKRSMPSGIIEGLEGNTARRRKKTSKSKVTGKSADGFEDSYWTDRIISIPEEDAFLSVENQMRTIADAPTPDGAPVLFPSRGSDGGNQSGGKTEGISPTAMILNFSDPDSIPSEEELNEIFRRYGSLLESETEVLKRSKRAKVVFKRKSDAETAFSSSGKFKTFGPSLNSYRLNYEPVLRKASLSKRLA
ncbi:hypothetical protein Dimus_007164 [Dionaea muscipula]